MRFMGQVCSAVILCMTVAGPVIAEAALLNCAMSVDDSTEDFRLLYSAEDSKIVIEDNEANIVGVEDGEIIGTLAVGSETAAIFRFNSNNGRFRVAFTTSDDQEFVQFSGHCMVPLPPMQTD